MPSIMINENSKPSEQRDDNRKGNPAANNFQLYALDNATVITRPCVVDNTMHNILIYDMYRTESLLFSTQQIKQKGTKWWKPK